MLVFIYIETAIPRRFHLVLRVRLACRIRLFSVRTLPEDGSVFLSRHYKDYDLKSDARVSLVF